MRGWRARSWNFPNSARLIWRMEADWPVRQICVRRLRPAGARMTYLSWDEIRPRVLTFRRCAFCGPDPGRGRETPVCTAYGDHPNEFHQLFSHRHDRADPGRGIGLGQRRAGAIAGTRGKPVGCAGASRGEQSGDAGARPVSSTRPGAVGDPCSGGKPRGPSRNSAGGRADPGNPAVPGAGSDRRSLRRTDHAGAQKGRHHQGHRQLGFGIRHPDRIRSRR